MRFEWCKTIAVAQEVFPRIDLWIFGRTRCLLRKRSVNTGPCRDAQRGSLAVAAFTWAVLMACAGPSSAGQAEALQISALQAGYVQIPFRADSQPQWLRVRSAVARPSKVPPQWKALIDSAASEPPSRQVAMVNAEVNRIPYAEDGDVYGAHDRWAAPGEFLSRNAGDCEDYALAKYAALRLLGWPDSLLRIVVVRDRKASVDHAVLSAWVDGDWLVLDSRSPRVASWRSVPQYQPIYAVNGKGMEVFVPRRSSVASGMKPVGPSPLS